ncbi:aminoglycoside phosphotransferase family protein [Spirillospora sp. NPDC050679]
MTGSSRLSWWAAPAHLRTAVEARLGGRVISAATQRGGFSPGVAARLLLDDGRRAFVKSASAELNPDTPRLHRAEARVAAALPEAAPVPRFLGSLDHNGWITLLFEDVDGRHPRQPWRSGELARVLDALTELAGAMTPAPLALPTAADRFAGDFRGWRTLAAEPGPRGLDQWTRDRLADLARREADWPAASSGATLAHADLRADNMLLTPDRVVIVDWPWACTAAPWFDLVLLLSGIAVEDGPPPQELFAAHPLAADAAPEAVDAVLTAITGYLVWRSRQPSPPGLPTLRAFQREMGERALTWLRHRLDGGHPIRA